MLTKKWLKIKQCKENRTNTKRYRYKWCRFFYAEIHLVIKTIEKYTFYF